MEIIAEARPTVITPWERIEERPRSVSGVKLANYRLVRSIYLDESGISVKEPVALVAGLIFNADKHWRPLNQYIKELITEYVPVEHQRNFSFHATELYHCSGKIFHHKKYPRERSREALKHLLSIPRRFGMPVAIGYFNKQAIDEAEGIDSAFGALPSREQAALNHASAFSLCCIAADIYMGKSAPDEAAQMIAENNNDTRKAIKLTHKILQGKWTSRLGREKPVLNTIATIAGVPSSSLPLTRIADTVLFADKGDSVVLQIADACAFILRYWAQGKSGQYVDEFFNAFTGDGKTLGAPFPFAFQSTWHSQ